MKKLISLAFLMLIVSVTFAQLGSKFNQSKVIGLQDSLLDRHTKDQANARFFQVSNADTIDGIYSIPQVDSIAASNLELANIKGYRLLGANIAAVPLGSVGSMNSTATALTDNTGIVMAFHITEATRVLGVKWIQGAAGTSVYDAYNGFVLFSASGGTYTRIDTTANSATLWTGAAYAVQTKAFTAQAILQPGVYILEIIPNWSTANTVVTIYGFSGANSSTNAMFTNSNKLVGTITSQTSAPSSLTGASITGTSVYPAVWLYK